MLPNLLPLALLIASILPHYADAAPRRADRVIIRLKAEATDAQLAALGAKRGLKSARRFTRGGTEAHAAKIRSRFARRAARAARRRAASLDRIAIAQVDPAASLEEALRALEADPSVEYVEPDWIMEPVLLPNDPFLNTTGAWGQTYGDLWGLHKIEAPAAWDAARGAGVVVAVVDTGVEHLHPDLQANIWNNPGETGTDAQGRDRRTNGIDDDGNGYIDDWRGWDATSCSTIVGTTCYQKTPDNDPLDRQGHGTHVAGTIAASGGNGRGIIGVAFESRIMPVQGLTDSGSGLMSDLARAVEYAADNGADVINNSWGAPVTSRFLNEVMEYAHGLGCVIVAAAGNDYGSDADGYSPARSLSVITVSAFNPNDLLAPFSNIGNKIDVAAPGDGLSTVSAGDGGILSLLSSLSIQLAPYAVSGADGAKYARLRGTSMAAPHVSGLAALILSKDPALSNEEVRQVIRASADDVGPAGFDAQSGYGRINARKALGRGAVLEAKILKTGAASGIYVSTRTEIFGRAQGAGLARWWLEYGASTAPAAYTRFLEGTQPVNGLFGSWDTTFFFNGPYVIRLNVLGADGTLFQDRITLVVDANAPMAPSQPLPNVPLMTRFGIYSVSWGSVLDAARFEIQCSTDGGRVYFSTAATYGNGEQNPFVMPPTSFLFTGIASGSYRYRVRAFDLAGNAGAFSLPTSTVTVDTDLPAISSAAVGSLGLSQATLTFLTNEPAAGGANFVGGASTIVRDNTGYKTAHSILLSSLSPGTTYMIRPSAQDLAGNLALGATITFTTPPDTTPPVVTIVSPAGGSFAAGLVSITAGASDASGVAAAQIYVDDAPLGPEDASYPYSAVWDTRLANDGAHAIKASARDLKGNTGMSAPVSVTVDNTRAAIVGLSAEPHFSSATLRWQTDEPARSSVRFGLSTGALTSVAVDSGVYASSFTLRLLSLKHRTTYYFSAESVDRAGNLSKASGSFQTAADVSPPTVSLLAPATAVLGSIIRVTAAADDDVAVWGVQFYWDDSPFGPEDVNPPFSSLWVTAGVSEGSHTVRAVARDFGGNFSTAAASIVVGIDRRPPAISALSAEAFISSATVTWTTDEPATSQVEFGTTTAYGSMLMVDSVLKTAHSRSLPLRPGTLYYYRAYARDPDGNLTVSSSRTLTTQADTFAPRVTVSVAEVYSPDVPSSTRVIRATAFDEIRVAGVQFQVDGQDIGAEDSESPYFAQWQIDAYSEGPHVVTAVARDESGNRASSSTISVIDRTPPAVVGLSTAAHYRWIDVQLQTGELSTARIDFGTSTANISQYSKSSPYLNLYHSLMTAVPLIGTVYYVRVSVEDAAGNVNVLPILTIQTLDATPPETAYDTVLKAPKCAAAAAVCDSGLLLDYKRGQEIHSPNTIGGSCQDGPTPSSFIDRVTVRSILGETMAPGTDVRIEARVRAWGSKRLDFYHTDRPEAPVWRLLATLTPPSGGVGQSLASTTTLPAGGLQAVRAVLREAATPAAPCVLDADSDHDDLIFAVAVDTAGPIAVIESPTAGSVVSGTVTISASASDPSGVAGVQFRVDGLNHGGEDLSTPFSAALDTTKLSNGAHTLSLVARDAFGNVSSAAPVSIVVDNQAPFIYNVRVGLHFSSMTVSWRTDELSDTQIAFGTTSATAQALPLDPSPVNEHSAAITGLQQGTTYFFRPISRDAAGNVSNWGYSSFRLSDRTPPTIPANVSLGQATTGSLVLSWMHSTDNVGAPAYRLDVARDASFTSFVLFLYGTSASSVTVYGLSPKTTYYARVRAYDAAGNWSPYSPTVSGRTAAAFSPADVDLSGGVNISDVQLAVNEAIGAAECARGDVNGDGACNVADVQTVVNAAF